MENNDSSSSTATNPNRHSGMVEKKRKWKDTMDDSIEDTERSSTGILDLPPAITAIIASYATGADEIMNLLSTNSALLAEKDYVMPSVLNRMEREEAFKIFSRLVVTGNLNAVVWFNDTWLTEYEDEGPVAPFFQR